MLRQCGAIALVAVVGVGVVCAGPEWKSGIVWPEPKVVTPGDGTAPPSDALVLFDGKDLSQWEVRSGRPGEGKEPEWILMDGYAEVRKHDIRTKLAFGDYQLHVEFATPAQVNPKQTGQGRGNSGVFLADRYEVQVLDSFDNATYFDGQCGSIYKQTPPMVNACRKPGEWQTYDILFESPRFADDGKVARPGYVTLFHNGIVVLNHFELQGDTNFDQPPAYRPHAAKMPIHLQNHGNPVRYRNIWIREMTPMVGTKPA
ncbi:MAG: DUF1080 domain-containing protein [Gemmataceae bacterium]